MLAATIAVAACATITKGADQTVTIISDPPGAECRLNRAGAILGIVGSTPGSVKVGKGGDPIKVTCKKAGFETATGVLSSEFEEMALGNIFFGGIVGAVVDAGSGAANQYPDSITVILIPLAFASAEQRDDYFARLKAYRTAIARQAAERARRNCVSRENDECESDIKKIEEARDSDLAGYERKRRDAVIDPVRARAFSR